MNTQTAVSGLLRNSSDRQPSPFLWLIVVGLTFQVVGLEIFNHLHHPVPHHGLCARLWLGPALSSKELWTFLNVVSYGLYLAPFALGTVRGNRGTVRRVLLGYGLQILFGATYLLLEKQLLPALLQPCLHVANAFFVLRVILAASGLWLRAVAFPAFALSASSTLLSGQHDWTDLPVGIVLGWVVYRVSFSSKVLGFLDEERPWAAFRRELANFQNLTTGNRPARWERMYEEGQWDFLNSPPEWPRHYVIAGIIRDRFPEGADVLDVGCGYGVLYPFLSGPKLSYVGIDLAEPAIRECRRRFAGDDRCTFETAAFENFNSRQKSDVVVLNEVLYYFPLSSIPRIVERARRLLKGEHGIIVVSMGRSPKVSRVWRRLCRVSIPEQVISIVAPAGRRWTVSVYTDLRNTRPGLRSEGA